MPRRELGRLRRELDGEADGPPKPAGRLGRRELIRRGLVIGAGGLAAGALELPNRSRATTAPSAVVVGAGFAGLTAAYRMWTVAGWTPAVYEARSRVGGRVRTIRTLPGGQLAEGGAQGISTNDHAITRLVSELELSLIDTWEGYPSGRTILHFDGRSYSRGAIRRDLDTASDHAAKHYDQIVCPASRANRNARTVYWDGWSVADWIDAYCPGGLGGPAGSYLKVYFENEYAGPIQKASALHLIADLGSAFDSGFDERYTVAGGNDLVATTIEGLLPAGTVRYGMALVAIRENTGGTSYTCSFESDATTIDVVADRVVLALPFSVFRRVDHSGAGFSSLKEKAIDRLGIGVNSKLNFQFRGAPWEPRSDGESLSDLTTGWTWESHSYQPGSQGLLTQLNSGELARQYGDHHPHGLAKPWVVKDQLRAIDVLFPEASSRFIEGQGYLDYWPADPWVRGSYSFYETGGFTTIGGLEAIRQGGIHFAGEHTAPYHSQATMNGAVISGERAAEEILRDYGFAV